MSLNQQLVDLIKKQGRIHWKDLERFCDKNGYRWADNGTKRLREVRETHHPNYDPEIDVEYYKDSKIIEFYVYRPVKEWWKEARYQHKQPAPLQPLF